MERYRINAFLDSKGDPVYYLERFKRFLWFTWWSEDMDDVQRERNPEALRAYVRKLRSHSWTPEEV